MHSAITSRMWRCSRSRIGLNFGLATWQSTSAVPLDLLCVMALLARRLHGTMMYLACQKIRTDPLSKLMTPIAFLLDNHITEFSDVELLWIETFPTITEGVRRAWLPMAKSVYAAEFDEVTIKLQSDINTQRSPTVLDGTLYHNIHLSFPRSSPHDQTRRRLLSNYQHTILVLILRLNNRRQTTTWLHPSKRLLSLSKWPT